MRFDVGPDDDVVADVDAIGALVADGVTDGDVAPGVASAIDPKR